MALQIKFLTRIPVWEIVFFRALITFILCAATIKLKDINPWGNNRRFLFLRGLFGTIAMCGVFTTFAHMPLAMASTLTKLAPLFAALVSSVFLGEKIGWKGWACYVLAFSGVLVTKGYEPNIPTKYFLIGIGAAFFASLAYNCIAKLKESEDPQVIMFYFPLVTLPLIAVPTYFHWVKPNPREMMLLLGVGCTVQIAQYFMTLSYQSGKPAKVSIVTYTGLLLACLYDVTIFHETPSPGSLLGMLLIVIGVGLSLLRKKD